MSLVTEDTLYQFLDIEEDTDAIALLINSAVEKFITNYCNRNFEAADYLEFYSGLGSQKLLLKHYPVINVKGVYLSTLTVMQIYNTNKYTNANVSVTSEGIVLEYNGVITPGNFTFATNTTLGTLETVLNNAGNGWVADVLHDYDSILSTELLEIFGQNAINNMYVDLKIPYPLTQQYKLRKEDGTIFFPPYNPPYSEITESPLYLREYDRFVEANDGTFSKGFNNIFVKYRAGYEEDEIPEDLQLAVLVMTKDLFDRREENSFGLTEYSLSSVISKTFDKQITEKILPIINKYRNINI